MADYQQEFRRILDEEVGDYAARALQLLAQAIQAKGLVLTQELLHSLRTQVVQATAQHVAVMQVEFEQYGRIKDMKALSRTKAPAYINLTSSPDALICHPRTITHP